VRLVSSEEGEKGSCVRYWGALGDQDIGTVRSRGFSKKYAGTPGLGGEKDRREGPNHRTEGTGPICTDSEIQKVDARFNVK